MEKTIIIFICLCLICIPITLAEAPPAPAYCEHQGYYYEYQESDGYCHFPDGTVCEAWAFFRGECGQEYDTKNFPCVKEGQLVWPEFEQCCEGLEPYLKVGTAGQTMCKNVSLLTKFWDWILSLFI